MICAQPDCSETFKPRASGRPQRFCSRRCGGKVAEKRRHRPREQRARFQPCAICREIFEPYTNDQRICPSSICRGEYRNRPLRMNREGRKCARCSGPIPAGRVGGSLYCSERCKQQQANSPRRNVYPTLPCAMCGDPFDQNQPATVHCSKLCWSRDPDTGDPLKRAANAARRRAALLERSPDWADKAAVDAWYFERPDGMEVDHYYPLQGRKVSGLHVDNNFQYLPPSENRSKGNKHPDKYARWRRPDMLIH